MIQILEEETEFTDARNYELITGRSSPVFGFSETRLQHIADTINTIGSAMQDMTYEQRLKVCDQLKRIAEAFAR